MDFIAHLRELGYEAPSGRARLLDADGNSVEIPDSMFAVLAQVAEAMKAGLAVTVAPHHLALSTRRLPTFCESSRTTLVRLLESGVIPFDKPSRHRKVRLVDLLDTANASAEGLTRR